MNTGCTVQGPESTDEASTMRVTEASGSQIAEIDAAINGVGSSSGTADQAEAMND